MTAPVRDPRPVSGMLGPCYRCGTRTGSLARVCITCAEKERAWEQLPEHWADRFTPDERSDLVRVCVRLKHLVADKEGDAPRELWQAAHTTLRELMDFIDTRGEQS